MDNCVYSIFLAGTKKSSQIKNVALDDFHCGYFPFSHHFCKNFQLRKEVKYYYLLSFSDQVSNNA
ncbi:MAG: hypothetical protein A3H39_10355 [candidate division NC10 bacterium RIFCSPLOWO2_02_FULL_66_22]|nr:MAG: hypothetical protein A3H39_10355 [candidate division NC10 bacterium RIFCSPLOWO2_02_FULL_66_22]